MNPIPLYGETVLVAFRLPGTDSLHETAAVVAWINPDEPVEVEALPAGCGLRFLDLDDDIARAIGTLVEDYLSIPRTLPPWLGGPGDLIAPTGRS